MLITTAILFATTVLNAPQNLEDEELVLSEKSAIIEQDDEASEDGELIFEDDEQVAELE